MFVVASEPKASKSIDTCQGTRGASASYWHDSLDKHEASTVTCISKGKRNRVDTTGRVGSGKVFRDAELLVAEDL